jgi:hypothetical protein
MSSPACPAIDHAVGRWHRVEGGPIHDQAGGDILARFQAGNRNNAHRALPSLKGITDLVARE